MVSLFRFKNKKTMNYLSTFTKWLPGDYIVKSLIDNKLYPIPINLETLELFFKKNLNQKRSYSIYQ